MSEPDQTPLVLIRGEATEEEVAALVAVLQGLRGAVVAASAAPSRPVSSWAAPSRKLRTTPTAGPGGWRASALPR